MINKKTARAKIPCSGTKEQQMLQERFKVGTKIRDGVVLSVEVVQEAIIVLFEAAANMVSTTFGVIHDFCKFDMGITPSLLPGEKT